MDKLLDKCSCISVLLLVLIGCIDFLFVYVLFKCFATYVLYYPYFMLTKKSEAPFKIQNGGFFLYLNITGLNNVHFSTNVVFPTDVVTGQIDYWTQFYNKLLQQAVVTVLKQFYLKNFLFL